MRIKLIHPLWAHIAAVAALVTLIVYVVIRSPLPVEAPVQFGLNGMADRHGSPWQVFGLTIGLSVFFILLSVFLDEIWARQERAKTFNWLSLLDEITVGMMVGTSLGYLVFLEDGASSFSFPWVYVLLVGGSSIALGIVVEIIRPFRLYPWKMVAEDSKTLEAELARRLRNKIPFVYWDYQNPPYVIILTTVIPLVMLVAAVLSWFSQPWLSLLLIVVGALFVIPYGGQRIMVTRQYITVRFGLLGIRVLRLRMDEVVGVELHEFAPLKDFGGYGIRFNREMKAYFLRGNRGVKITTIGGKKYLIGSDHADRLSSIISAVSPAT